jgi:hypothetical protein
MASALMQVLDEIATPEANHADGNQSLNATTAKVSRDHANRIPS